MQYDSIFLGKIRDCAMNLYQNHNVMPPEHIKRAMNTFGVPESDQWGVFQAIKPLGLVEQPQLKKTTKKKNIFRRSIIIVPSIDGKSLAAGER